jgi:hypothetical protein
MELSPRFQARRECCQVRLLASMPRHARATAYQQARQTEGADAEQRLKDLVAAEYQRQNGERLALAKKHFEEMKKLIGARPR